VDVGSLNGTYVNREAVESAALLNGDQVQIGKFRLVFPSARTTAATGNRGAGDRTRCPQLRCGRVSFAGRRFNVAHRILLTGIASQAAACKQSLRILLLVNRTYSTRALNADGERGQVIAAGVGGCCSASARRAAR
jgi:FHA domain